MVSITEALERIHANVKAAGTEILPIESAVGYVSAEHLHARFDLPRFDNSAMDGYAVTMADAGGIIASQPTIFAGDESDVKVRPGYGVKIMTGAVMPKGADAVIPVENTIETAEGISLPDTIKRGAHIRKKGEDITKGERILSAGETITAYALTQLASQGITHVRVFQKPRVTVFATGHELRMHYEPIEAHQIYNSNAPMFIARSLELGCDARFTGATADTMESIKAHIAAALDADLIITSGGVSVGDADFTKEAFAELGMETLFSKVDIKPGKPTSVGRIGKTWVVNLPGNPSAAAVNFEIFARSIINRLHGMQAPYIAPIVTLCAESKKIKPGKYSVLMGRFDGEGFEILEKQGPGMVSPLKEADGLIIVTPKVECLEKGQRVRMIPLRCNQTAESAVELFTSV
ncbi:molybdopterin molybdotransferase MoeA [Hydrogenimonas cancrithermarum]|uniref:Molybdopterin molybdenumtransferase n=1 Tax=Hydrogenimonas cancrithermarum TaxID=2993563 RepID=A0ABM8FMN8_9BACT|nr:gephyrin-like molybdotransferase Glp [Hydrogenimonas cancrithermarum]BDY12778.1 molybdopterin molybdenumtransferase MoeA [Hydrogenimonas cancrithermarum]